MRTFFDEHGFWGTSGPADNPLEVQALKRRRKSVLSLAGRDCHTEKNIKTGFVTQTKFYSFHWREGIATQVNKLGRGDRNQSFLRREGTVTQTNVTKKASSHRLNFTVFIGGKGSPHK